AQDEAILTALPALYRSLAHLAPTDQPLVFAHDYDLRSVRYLPFEMPPGPPGAGNLTGILGQSRKQQVPLALLPVPAALAAVPEQLVCEMRRGNTRHTGVILGLAIRHRDREGWLPPVWAARADVEATAATLKEIYTRADAYALKLRQGLRAQKAQEELARQRAREQRPEAQAERIRELEARLKDR